MRSQRARVSVNVAENSDVKRTGRPMVSVDLSNASNVRRDNRSRVSVNTKAQADKVVLAKTTLKKK
jgi:hypothetical protein